MPRCNTEAMNLHLAEIATQIAPGAHAALLVDQAGWHLSGRLIVPSNITLIPFPAKSPELNPQENIWQSMRENWLSNRIFKSFDDIVDHCCEAWNKLVDQPWRIMSIGMRDWAYGSYINHRVLVLARSIISESKLKRRPPPAGYGA
jgi:transposase